MNRRRWTLLALWLLWPSTAAAERLPLHHDRVPLWQLGFPLDARRLRLQGTVTEARAVSQWPCSPERRIAVTSHPCLHLPSSGG